MPRLSNGSESLIEPHDISSYVSKHQDTYGKAQMSPFVTHTGTKRELEKNKRKIERGRESEHPHTRYTVMLDKM